MDSVRVPLSSPVEYMLNGGTRQAQFVELRAPSSRAYKVALRIKQGVMKAVMEQQAKAASIVGPHPEPAREPEPSPIAEDSGPDGGAFLQMLAASSADLGSIAEDVRTLIAEHGVAWVDGETPMTPLLLDRLTLPDFEAVLGEYLARFPLA